MLWSLAHLLLMTAYEYLMRSLACRIDGIVVVSNDYNQGVTCRIGSIDLSLGPHEMVIGYFQGLPNLMCLVMYH